MVLTTKNIEYHPKKLEIMRELTKFSKDLFNFTLYKVRQIFIKEKIYLPYLKMYPIIKSLENDLGEIPYKSEYIITQKSLILFVKLFLI